MTDVHSGLSLTPPQETTKELNTFLLTENEVTPVSLNMSAYPETGTWEAEISKRRNKVCTFVIQFRQQIKEIVGTGTNECKFPFMQAEVLNSET
jgi:hypothetical protein